MKRFFLLALIFLISACAAPTAVPPTATLTPMMPTATLEPSPTATQLAPTEAVPTVAVELLPQTVGCLHPEDIATWCANLEAKDPHGLWQSAIDALVDGPANGDYWSSTLGKTNPTHEEKLAWLTAKDYFLPATSPNGTDFLWIAGTPAYAEFKVNKVVKDAGGVSLQNIPNVVVSPDNWTKLKDWWRAKIDAQRSSPPILTGGSTVYSPAEIYGWMAVANKKTGLVEMVFVGGTSYIPDYSKQQGYNKVMIGGEGSDSAAIFSAMWSTFMRATVDFDTDDLDLKDPRALNPRMGIVDIYGLSQADYPTDPEDMTGENALFK